MSKNLRELVVLPPPAVVMPREVVAEPSSDISVEVSIEECSGEMLESPITEPLLVEDLEQGDDH